VSPRRYALSGYLAAAVIGGHFGLTSPQLEAQLLTLRQGAAANQKTFFLSGTQHSVIGEGATKDEASSSSRTFRRSPLHRSLNVPGVRPSSGSGTS
jgi:hypothetical protein